MSLLTTWGYTLTETDKLTDMLTFQEFNEFTGNKYKDDHRVGPNIKAVSQAIRNYCGWHIYPSSKCRIETTFFDRRVTFTGRDLLIQLPAKFVSTVSLVEIDGVTYQAVASDPNGLVMVYGVDGSGLHEYSPVVVEYTAGLQDEFMDSIKELAAHRITHALASSGGVQSETAGGVSITYSASWTNSARSTALADDNKEVIQPYRLQGVF